MTLADRNPGDYLVVIENGERVNVELGAVLMPRDKRSKTSIDIGQRSALVTTLDENLFPVEGTWRAISPLTEVVAVIASISWLRQMRHGSASTFDERDGHDPLRDGRRGRF